MKSMKMVLSLVSTLAIAACGDTMPVIRDAGGDAATMPGNDASAMTGTDAGRRDAATSNDPCAASDMNANSTVGCNGGFASGMPAMNAAGGACTGGGMAAPMGSCMANMTCTGDAMMAGICLPNCTPGATYVSRGMCPMGFRCFDLGGAGACFRDCNAANPCPTGQMCDGEGSCVPPMMMGKPSN